MTGPLYLILTDLDGDECTVNAARIVYFWPHNDGAQTGISLNEGTVFVQEPPAVIQAMLYQAGATLKRPEMGKGGQQ